VIGVFLRPILFRHHRFFVDHRRNDGIVRVRQKLNKSIIENLANRGIAQNAKHPLLIYDLFAMKNYRMIWIVLENVALDLRQYGRSNVARVI